MLNDGRVLSGRVVSERDGVASVQTNPYDDALESIALTNVDDRWTSEVSAMPDGLLTTFTKDEITDLVGYVVARRRD